MTENCLLNLVVSPEVEDSVTDWLLAHVDVGGFSSHTIAGHGSSEHSMTLAEQVAGRRRQILFQMHLTCAGAQALLDAIKADFHGSGMHYWILPILDSGHVD
jgi:hypothetical protein